MARQPLSIVSVGECTIDHYPDLQREFIGGISFNFAVHCKRSGAEHVSLVSCVGKDREQQFLNTLLKEGVDASHISIGPDATAKQEISLTTDGERIFPLGGYHPGVLEGYLLDEDGLQFVQQHHVLASALYNQIEPLFRQVMEMPFEGWRIADFLDLSDYDRDTGIIEQYSERLAIAFVSGDQEMVEKLRPLSSATNCLVVITLGAKGSVALEKGEPVYQPSIDVPNALDSTGCGDAFQAAFTVSYWHDADLQLALERGAQQAATVLQHYGASD